MNQDAQDIVVVFERIMDLHQERVKMIVNHWESRMEVQVPEQVSSARINYNASGIKHVHLDFDIKHAR